MSLACVTLRFSCIRTLPSKGTPSFYQERVLVSIVHYFYAPTYRLYFEVRFVLLPVRAEALDGVQQIRMGLKEVRIRYENWGSVLAGADVLEALDGLVLARVVAPVLGIVCGIAVGVVRQSEQIRGDAVLLRALHIPERNDAAEVLVVDVYHLGLGEVPRREEGPLRPGNAGAGLLVPVRQVVHAVEGVDVAELVHALHARLDGGDLHEGAVAPEEQAHALHGSHVLRIEPVGQTHQGVVIAEGQLLGGYVYEGFELGRRHHHGNGLGQEVAQLGTQAGEGLEEVGGYIIIRIARSPCENPPAVECWA